MARQVFAGIGRGEFIIHLLEADGEIVGFAIVRYCRALIADATSVDQQLLFIRPDVRSAEAELALHGLAISLIQATNSAEAFLVVSPGPQAGDVIASLTNAGLGRFALRMSLAPTPHIAPQPLPQQSVDVTVH